jgi:hypothetical protein
MVPNISRNGRSFRGAGAYHLHDKPDSADTRPRTSARVAFTATRNLANADPHAALDEMWRTAEDARHLKARSGLAPTGRKNETPVKTVSLAWAPGQSPAREEMCAAADSFLKAMGWAEHQALYVAHNDTAHSHLHLIINRVHPDTGRTLQDWQERKRAQRWALDYEREHGAVLCPGRAARHEARAYREKSRAALPYRDARLLGSHDAASRTRIAKDVRAAFRPSWAAHYRRQHAALRQLDRDQRTLERTAVALTRAGDAPGALKVLEDSQQRREILLRSFQRERATIARLQHADIRNGLAGRRPPVFAPADKGQERSSAIAPRAAPAKDTTPSQAPLRRAPQPSTTSFRFASLRAGTPRAGAAPKSERNPFPACAARETLRPLRSASAQAAARARAEIAVLFAHRWAAIRRMPTQERAAAAAALQAEQAAALAARTKHLLEELQQEQRTQHAQRRTFLAARRIARLTRRREAWAAAASVMAARRTEPAPARPSSHPSAALRSVRHAPANG